MLKGLVRTLLHDLQVKADVESNKMTIKPKTEPKGGLNVCEAPTINRADRETGDGEDELDNPWHPIADWALRHAAWLLSTYHKGVKDGETAYERLHGKPYSGKIMAFGSPVLWLDETPGAKREAGPRWRPGMWVGVMTSTPKAIVLTQGGAAKETGAVKQIKDFGEVNAGTRACWLRSIGGIGKGREKTETHAYESIKIIKTPT